MTFCVLAEECSVYDRTAQLPGIARSTPLCEGCRRRSESELNLLRYDYVDLSQLIPARDGHSDAKIARPKPASKPTIDLQVFTLRGEIAYALRVTEVALRVYLGDRVPAELPVREGFAMDNSIRYLQPRVDELAGMPATEAHWRLSGTVTETLSGPEVLLLLGRLHHRARKICGLEPMTITVPGMCPSCSTASLRRKDDDDDKIWCIHCRLVFSKEMYFQSQRMIFTRPSWADERP